MDGNSEVFIKYKVSLASKMSCVFCQVVAKAATATDLKQWPHRTVYSCTAHIGQFGAISASDSL